MTGDLPKNGKKETKMLSGKCEPLAMIVATTEVGAAIKW